MSASLRDWCAELDKIANLIQKKAIIEHLEECNLKLANVIKNLKV